MPDIDYTIRTHAELAGAEAAAEAMERQIGKMKALRQDSSELQKQLEAMRASIADARAAHESQGEAMTEEAAQTEKLTLGKRELLESMRGITREFPVMGEAIRAIFNPITAVVASLIGMIGSVFSALKKVEDLELPDLTSGIDQADQLGEKWAGIGKSVADTDAAFFGWEETHARALTAITSELKATQDLIKAKKDRALAQLEIEHAAGMDEGEYKRKKSFIERGATAADTQAEIDANAAKAAALQKATADAVADANEKSAAAASFKGPQSKEQAEAEIAALKITEDAERKKAEDAKKRVAEIQDVQSDEASAKGYGANVMVGLERWRELFRHLGADNESLSAGDDTNITAQKKVIDDAKTKADGDAAEAARIKKAAAEKERLEKEADDAVKKARKLQDESPAEITALNVANKNLAARQNDNDTSAEIKADADAFSGDVEKARRDISTANEIHGKATQTAADAAKASTAINNALAAVTDAAAAVSDLRSLGQNVAKLNTIVAELRTQISQVKHAVDTY